MRDLRLWWCPRNSADTGVYSYTKLPLFRQGKVVEVKSRYESVAPCSGYPSSIVTSRIYHSNFDIQKPFS